MSTEIMKRQEHGIAELERMGAYIAKSGLFGMKTTEQAVALMIVAQAEDRHPGSAAQDYHIIQGRPALKADAMLSRFQAAGGRVEWTCYTDEKVEGKFSHPSGGTIVVDWDMARAKKADLGTKDNWKKYPRQMLRARVISEGIRTVYPAVLGGMYTPEEVVEFDDPKQPVVTVREETKKLDKWNEFCSGKDYPEDAVLAFVCERASATSKRVEQVQAAAYKSPEKFWSAFSDWLDAKIPPEVIEEVDTAVEVLDGKVVEVSHESA